MLSTQLENAVIELLSQFITNDFGKLEKLKDNYETAMQGEGEQRNEDGEERRRGRGRGRREGRGEREEGRGGE